MKPLLLLLLAMSIPAAAQSADAIYQQACGPKEALFDVKQVKKPEPAATPASGKALVYFIQDEDLGLGFFTTRIGLDGAWVGALRKPSFVSISVAPGEHHACASWQDLKSQRPLFLHWGGRKDLLLPCSRLRDIRPCRP
jgi:hypothetical protein